MCESSPKVLLKTPQKMSQLAKTNKHGTLPGFSTVWILSGCSKGLCPRVISSCVMALQCDLGVTLRQCFPKFVSQDSGLWRSVLETSCHDKELGILLHAILLCTSCIFKVLRSPFVHVLWDLVHSKAFEDCLTPTFYC